MALYSARFAQNAPGLWYVDSSCIDCDLCRETAGAVFRRDEEIGNSVVFHQPESKNEKRLAEEARAACPTDSIGNDGPPVQRGLEGPGP